MSHPHRHAAGGTREGVKTGEEGTTPPEPAGLMKREGKRASAAVLQAAVRG